MTGWILKKGRNRRNWKKRWFVLAGPFLLYYDSPQGQIAHDIISDNFLFLKDFIGFDILGEEFSHQITISGLVSYGQFFTFSACWLAFFLLSESMS